MTRTIAILLGLLLAGATARAQSGLEPPGKRLGKGAKRGDKGAKRVDRRAERTDAKAKRLDARAGRLEQRAERKQVKPDGELDRAERIQQIKLRAKQRRDTRAQRRDAERKRARVRARAALRGKTMDAALTQELRRHARRTARLERIREVAAEQGDMAAIERCDALLAKERARHDRWMSRLPPAGGAQ